MAKINIIKPTGSEAFNLISAFKEDGNTYVVFDSERMGSMGLPIIYIFTLIFLIALLYKWNCKLPANWKSSILSVL